MTYIIAIGPSSHSTLAKSEREAAATTMEVDDMLPSSPRMSDRLDKSPLAYGAK